MAAPTPVSSLVHSSTLVTAGVYLIIRFNRVVMYSGLNFILLFISIFTMIIYGIRALYENDIKKIIALSTLRQLGLIIIILGLGLNLLGFYHLLTHAVFKSLLFLYAGIIIHLIKNNQDIHYYGGLRDIIPFKGAKRYHSLSIVFYTSILSIIGCPFLAGFYSKDLIMEFLYIYDFNILLIVIMLISLFLTVMYSLRLFYYLFFIKSLGFISVGNLNESRLINFSIVLLLSLRVIRGSLLN
jgi:NADH-ubiquinone oxidoreductase chain 5